MARVTKDRYHGKVIKQDRSTTEMRLLRDVLSFEEDSATSGLDHATAVQEPNTIPSAISNTTFDQEIKLPTQKRIHHFISEKILTSQPTDFMTAYIHVVQFLDKAIEDSRLRWQDKAIMTRNIFQTLREIEQILSSQNPENEFMQLRNPFVMLSEEKSLTFGDQPLATHFMVVADPLLLQSTTASGNQQSGGSKVLFKLAPLIRLPLCPKHFIVPLLESDLLYEKTKKKQKTSTADFISTG